VLKKINNDNNDDKQLIELLIEFNVWNNYMERTILQKYLKIELDTDLKIIMLAHQNNYVGNSSMMSNAAKNFNILGLHNYF